MRIFAKAYLCPAGASTDESRRLLSGANPGSMVQAARGDIAGNELFVEFIAAQTLRAESSGCLLAKRKEIDFLLRLAGTSQISRAIRDAGAKPGEKFLLVVAARAPVARPPSLVGTGLPRHELTDSELGRIERAALLNAKRA